VCSSDLSDNIGSENLLIQTVEQQLGRYYGKFRGTVSDVDDPENMGRIKAKVPELYGEVESPWALPVVPFAGPGHGLVLLPEIDDGIWIECEAGDISRPLWVGGWWGHDELPDPGAKKVRTLATTAGHKLVLDDDGDKLQLLHSDGAELTMTSDSITIKIGSTQIVLNSSGVSVNQGALEVR
jgi:uncharacterized protein involved in type VI secretion and phage assembly